MASVIGEISTALAPERAWDAIRDVGALHSRLVPGFVVATSLERNGNPIADASTSVAGVSRAVRFGNGLEVIEPIIDRDDRTRRLVWGATGGPLTHYNASCQVFADGDGGSRVVWIADLLPDAARDQVGAMIGEGLRAMKLTFDAVAGSQKPERT
ncbi:MAG: SRPBCC family protein [Pseudomonadota bacterium]|uniref:SRPBCC family protein n=1 Tax=Sphingomonas sp. ERG5 TaxID=1381597 RepID=UPI00054C61E6|nr:SRPBCC family protein [Sphingomonas sp. ERG5]